MVCFSSCSNSWASSLWIISGIRLGLRVVHPLVDKQAITSVPAIRKLFSVFISYRKKKPPQLREGYK